MDDSPGTAAGAAERTPADAILEAAELVPGAATPAREGAAGRLRERIGDGRGVLRRPQSGVIGRWGFAVIGDGPWLRRALRTLAGNKRVRLVSVPGDGVLALGAGRPAGRGASPARCRTAEDPRALLESDEVDVVLIASDSSRSSALARTALEAGKHVVVRKLPASSAQCRELARLAARERRLLVLAGDIVFTDGLLHLRALVHGQGRRRDGENDTSGENGTKGGNGAGGELGTLRSIRLIVEHPAWRGASRESIAEVAPRELAALDFLAGSAPEEVSARVLDDGGLVARLRYPRLCHVPVTLEIRRSGARVRRRRLTVAGSRSEALVERFPPATERLFEHILDALDAGCDSPLNGARTAIGLARTAEAMRRSAELAGTPLRLAGTASSTAPSAASSGVEAPAPPRESTGAAPVAPAHPARRARRRRPDRPVDQPVYRIDSYPEMVRAIRDAWNHGEGVWIASRRLEWMAQRLRITARTADGLPKIWFGPARRGWVDRILTRGLDVACGIASVTVGLPIWVAIAAIVKLDGGPLFYISRRSGQGGTPFRFIKFRSMAPESDDREHREFMADVIRGNGTKYADDTGRPLLKNPNDRRVTRFGKLLRKTSLDEFPQFLHVLAGKMSVVGPRPPIPYEVECYEDWMEARLHGPVGITGLWQVNGRNEVSFEDQVLLDVYYIANRSFLMDLGIIARTPLVMLSGRGAF